MNIKKWIKKCVPLFLFGFILATTLPVHANPNDVTVEGDMTRFATGDAYPNIIQFAGYNAQTNDLYLNIGFEDGDTATDTYDYEVNIFQGDTGELWATTTNTGIAEANPTDPTVLEVQNLIVTGATDLKIGHRIVATVTNFVDNP